MTAQERDKQKLDALPEVHRRYIRWLLDRDPVFAKKLIDCWMRKPA